MISIWFLFFLLMDTNWDYCQTMIKSACNMRKYRFKMQSIVNDLFNLKYKVSYFVSVGNSFCVYSFCEIYYLIVYLIMLNALTIK